MAESPKEPQVKVVDRRWWARGNSNDSSEETSEQKPTVVDDRERQVVAVSKEGYVIGEELLRPASVAVGAHG